MISEKAPTKVQIAKEKSEKYYKQFDFFFIRSIFRIMTEFYKIKFQEFYSQKQKALKKNSLPPSWQRFVKNGGICDSSKEEIMFMVREFASMLFGPKIFSGCPEEQRAICHAMIGIIFSHRFNKGDKFISEPETQSSVDFSIVRDVMYKYSKKAQDRFLAHPVQSFMLAVFALSDDGLLFLKNKSVKQETQQNFEKLRRLQ